MRKSREELIEELKEEIRRNDRAQLVRRWALDQLVRLVEKERQKRHPDAPGAPRRR